MTDARHFPAPTMVVGVGRLGLATLEQLAEDWHRLKMSSQDPSIKNLRLLYVRPEDDGASPSWREPERQLVEIARYTGDGDLPSLALDFAILRSLGLIRYRDGVYQVAHPRDAGIVEQTHSRRLARRRYFDWITLHLDPLAAAERLEILTDKSPTLGLFVKPIVNRVRQGHSPRALLRIISRCRALTQGRDPSPWLWFHDLLKHSHPTPNDQSLPTHHTLSFDRRWISADDLHGLLEGFASEPLSGWSDWFKATHHDWVNTPDVSRIQFPKDGRLDINLPSPFLPGPRDLPSPLVPFNLLRVDWETNGWATEGKNLLGEVEFIPVPCSMYRLGLFDHDSSSRVHRTQQEDFCKRLELLGLHVHRGLVRLWVDLQRNRVEDQSFSLSDMRRREGVDETLRQSLEVLGELLVSPLLNDNPRVNQPLPKPPAAQESLHDDELPLEPSEFLRDLELDRRGEQNLSLSALTERLIELGFGSQDALIKRQFLLKQITLNPDHLSSPRSQNESGMLAGAHDEHVASDGLLAFRHTLNEQTRQLYDFDYLSSYRQRPTRSSARLSIFVVGDVAEPFVRASMRSLLREIHAELLRSFAPIFENFREGFDRSLSVTPILWMPHPADAFGGMHPVQNRCEEAAIIESIHGIRRWVETVPRGTRCIPQVIINSRVTDNAVLTRREAVSQTRDFLSFQLRNDMSRDAWLRKTVVGPTGDDFFASFSCHEVIFPAERAREYLANRLARETVAQIRRGENLELPEDEQDEDLLPPELAALIKPSTARTRQRTRKAAEVTGQLVEDRLQPAPHVSAQALQGAFDEEFERELLKHIYSQWRTLTRARGEMDEMMNALRRQTSDQLGKTLGLVRKKGDALIDEHASHGGLKAAQAGFNRIESQTREHLVGSEEQRQRSEDICRAHRIPQTSPIGTAREQLVELMETKPELNPMRFGAALWVLMAPALAAPVIWGIARGVGLNQRQNIVEFIFGPLGPIIGGVLLALPVLWLLRRHMLQIIDAIKAQIASMAETARTVVEGSGSSFGSSPSIRSFIEARLQLTAALNTRNYALRVHERVVQDVRLAHRLARSVDIQEDMLTRRAEDLGVRTRMGASQDNNIEDLSNLFAPRGQGVNQRIDLLIQPQQLSDFYLRHYGDEKELRAFVPTFISEVGGFGAWRKQACMSDTTRLMVFTRSKFAQIVERPVSELYMFEDEVGASLMSFVAKYYSNMGFGAKFMGYEGLDPDGINILCDTALVINPALDIVFEQARRKPGSRLTETLQVVHTEIQPNTAYMLSFVQGIRPHSVRNLMRFESYHDRIHMPDDRAFPLSGEGPGGAPGARPINHLTGFDALRQDINQRVMSALSDQSASSDKLVSLERAISGDTATEDVTQTVTLAEPDPKATQKRNTRHTVQDLTRFVPEEDLLDLWLRQQLGGLDG